MKKIIIPIKNNICEGLTQHLAQSNSGNIDTDFFF